MKCFYDLLGVLRVGLCFSDIVTGARIFCIGNSKFDAALETVKLGLVVWVTRAMPAVSISKR